MYIINLKSFCNNSVIKDAVNHIHITYIGSCCLFESDY